MKASVEIWPQTADPSMTMTIWLTRAGQTFSRAGGSTTRVKTCARVKARLSAASIRPRGVALMPERRISVA